MAHRLYAHQQRFIDKNPDRALLVWETGTGKTVAACSWLNKRSMRALVICPKAIVGKWERDLAEWKVKNTTVIAMSQLSKVRLDMFGAVVIDEAQHFASPLFAQGRSQRTAAIYNFIRSAPGVHVLLLTATPVRSTPYNIHTLATFVGKFWILKDFRERFFYFTDMFGRWHWEKRNGWQTMIRPYVEEISDIVLMQDCIDVPLQSEQIVRIPWKKDDEAMLGAAYLEPAAEWHARHRAENGRTKFDELMRILDGYRKAIVVCHYTQQIEDYKAWIGGERQVFVLNGAVNNQDEVIEAAKAADDCIFIVQASMGAGFDASEFSVVIFASMSFRYVDMVQMKGRVKRINNLHENLFIYLLGGKCDESVYATIQAGKDFDPHEYLKRAAATPQDAA
ncbi:MAG: helicase-related protein [Patescibacteria group bacterium]